MTNKHSSEKQKMKILATSALLSILGAPVLAQQNNLKDFISDSEYLRVIIEGKSNYAYNMEQGFRASPNNFKIWGSVHRACPTRTWWSNDFGSQKDVQAKLQELIEKDLKGFPKSTISKCLEVSPIFSNSNPTEHWRNKEMFYTNDAAVSLKDNKSGNVSSHRSLVSSNLSDKKRKTEVRLYNENLQLVCSMKNINLTNKSADADCLGLGRGKAIAEQKGKEITFAVITQNVTMFSVINSSLEKAKSKYPEIFK